MGSHGEWKLIGASGIPWRNSVDIQEKYYHKWTLSQETIVHKEQTRTSSGSMKTESIVHSGQNLMNQIFVSVQ